MKVYELKNEIKKNGLEIDDRLLLNILKRTYYLKLENNESQIPDKKLEKIREDFSSKFKIIKNERKMPKTVDAIYKNEMSSAMAAYIELGFEHYQNFLVGGDFETRKPIMKAVKEIAKQFGEIYPVTSGLTEGILTKDTPYTKEDYLSINFDDATEKDSISYLTLLADKEIKGSIAEISAGSVRGAEHKLENEPRNVPRFWLQAIIDNCMVYTTYGP